MADRYQHLLDSLTEEIVVFDQALRLVYANPTWLRRFGLSPSLPMGQPCHAVLLEAASPCASDLCAIQQVLQTGEPSKAPCHCCQTLAPGISISASPVVGSAGQVQEVILILSAPSPATQDPERDKPSAAELVDPALADALHKVALITSSQQDLRSVLDALLDHLKRLVAFDSASIMLRDRDGWRILAGKEFPADLDVYALLFPEEDAKITEMHRTRRPVIVSNVKDDDEWISFKGTEYIHSWMGAPLLVQDRMIGTLNLDKSEPGFYDEKDAQLVMAFANQAAVIVENARLVEAERQRAAQLRLIGDISQRVLAILDPQALMDYAAQAIQGHFGFYHVDIFVTDPSGEYLVFQTSSRQDFAERQRDQGLRFRIGDEGINGHVAATGQAYLANDVQQDPHYVPDKHLPEACSELAVPIKVGKRILGVLDLNSNQINAFDEDDLFVAQSLADQLALGLENARLFAKARRHAIQLQAAAKVAQGTTATLDVNQLLDETVRLISDRFGFYHAAIFLVDQQQEYAVLSAASSDGGQRMLKLKHKLPVGQVGIVGHVAQTGLPRIALDVGKDAVHFANPDLPDTRSEMALPLISRGRVIGVLDVQSTKEAAFSMEDMAILQTMADQLANATENARLYQETQQRLKELTLLFDSSAAVSTSLDTDRVLQTTARQAMSALGTQGCAISIWEEEQDSLVSWLDLAPEIDWWQSTPPGTTFPLADYPAYRQAITEQQPLTLKAQDPGTDPALCDWMGKQRIQSLLIVPMITGGKVIGLLELMEYKKEQAFGPTEIRLCQTLSNQAAAALENAHLYQQVSHHLEEVQLLNKVAVAASASLELGDVIRRSLEVLIGTRNFERVHVLIHDEERGDLWLHPGARDLFPQRASFRVPLGSGVTGIVAQSGQPLRLDNVRQEPKYIPGYEDTISELAVPLRVGDRIIGVLDVQSTQPHAFTESDQRLLTTLASQLGAIIENVRLFEETQLRVRELTALTQVSQALNEAQDLQTTLEVVLKEAFNLMSSEEGSVILIEPPGSNQLRMVAERGLGPGVVEEFNNRPVYSHEGTYKRALEDGQIVEVPDVSQDPDFLTDVGSRAKAITNIPLMTERGAIGLIAVDGVPKNDTTRRLLAALADMAAVAIDKEQLHEETINRLAEVSTLYTLSTQITSSLSSDQVLESIVAILRLTLDCRACSIFLVDSTGEYLRLEAASGPSSSWKGVARLEVGEGISGRVITEQRAIYVPDTHLESDFIFFDPQIRSLLVVPLVVRDEVVGTLSIDGIEPNAFDNEIRLLTIAAAQAAVAIENAELYENLQGSYTQLEQAYNELRELDRMKSEFVQNISHELRTPLTFIRGYIELLQDGDMGEMNQEQQAAIDIVARKSNALSRLVNDIISLQQASKERLDFEAISLVELGHACVQAAMASATDEGITLLDEIPKSLPPVLADRQRLSQVFDNLLGNAIKFSNPGDTVTVRMYVEGTLICTEVEDTGIGIAEEKLPRIFDRFYQVDGTTTRRFGGTGLGLAISKQIVEAHSGQIGVKSELEKGSVFYFAIPVADVDHVQGGLQA